MGTTIINAVRARARRISAVLAVMAVLATPLAPAGGGLLGDLLDDILDPIQDILDPILGGIGDATGLPLDEAVDSLIDDTVGGLVETAETILIPDDGAPLDSLDIETLSQLALLEPIDPLIEDVLVPVVLDPLGDVLAPVGDAGIPLGDFDIGAVVGEVVSVLRPALEPVGLDAAAYVIRADGPAGVVTQDALVDVPTPVDLTGDGLPDVTVELRVLTARPSVRIIRLPGAPSDLAGSVEAVLAPEGWSSPSRLAVGFDSHGAEIPSTARATITDLGTTSGTLAADVHTVGAGDTLALTASVYDQGAGMSRVEPTDVRLSTTPVPADLSVSAQGALDGFDSGHIVVTASSPTRIDAGVTTTGPDGDATEIAVVVDEVPGTVDLGVERLGDGATVDYHASGPVDRLALRLGETTGGVTRTTQVGIEGLDATSATFSLSATDLGFDSSAPIDALTVEIVDPRGVVDRATELRARLVGLPDAMDVDLGDLADVSGGLTFDALGGELDLLEVQLTSGPDLALDPSVDGVILEDTVDHFAAFVRLSGVRSLELATSDGFEASLATTRGRRFVAAVDTDGTRIEATLSALPAEVDVALRDGGDGTTLDYTASSVVDTLTVGVTDPTGFAADVVVDALPTQVTASIDDGAIDWQASAGVPSLAIDVADPTGFGAGITDVRARLVDVPATLRATLDGGGVDVDARPGVIGSVDVAATDGTSTIAVPDGVSGLVVDSGPSSFAAAARVVDLGHLSFVPDPLTLTLQTASPSVFEVDIAQADTDGTGTDVRATIDALPPSVTVGVAEVDGTPTLDYAASDSVDTLVASITQHRGAASPLTIDVEVHDLPTAMTLGVGDDGVHYSGSEVVPLLRAHVVDPDGLVGLATDLSLELTDLPTAVDVGIGTDGELRFATDGSMLGTLDALLTSGPELGLPDGVDGVLLIDEPDSFVAVVHVTGLRSISFDTDTGTGFSLGTAGGHPFELDVRQRGVDGSTTDVRATLDPLPADVSLAMAGGAADGFGLDYTGSAVMDTLRASLTQTAPGEEPTTAVIEIDDLPTALSIAVGDAGDVAYSASGSVPRLALDLSSAAGLFDRANRLTLRAVDLPTGITAALDAASGLQATTSGGPIGSLEALLTSGEEIALADGVDGIVLRDTPAVFALFARLTGVSGIGFATADGGASLSLDTTAARTLEVDVETENPEESSSSSIRATLDALPSSVSLSLGSDDAGRTVTYEASAPMDRLFGDVVLSDAEGTSSFAIEAIGVPETLDLGLASAGALSYEASDGIDRLTVTGENADGLFLRATRLQALLEDLPPSLSVLLGENGDLGLVADGGRLGHLDVLATNGAALAPVDGSVGAVIRDTADDFVVALRFDDVDAISVRPDPVAIQVDTAGGDRFVVQALLDGGTLIDLGAGSVSVEAVIEDLPASVTLGFGVDGAAQELSIDGSDPIDLVTFQLAQLADGASAPLTADLLIEDVPTSLALSIDISGVVTYAASAPVPLLVIDAVDPSGLFDRATDLELRLLGLPLGLDVGLSDTGSIAIATTGGKLGQIEALATTGPENRVPAGNDGILLEDLPDRFVVSARFTNLYSGDVSQVPRPTVKLVTDGGRPLSLGLYQSEPGKPSRMPGVAFTEASLVDLPSDVSLELLDGDPGTINIEYEASETADSLTLETNAGDRWITQASISDPVPLWFTACQAGDTRCVDSGQSDAGIGSFQFLAERHTTLNVLDCARPLNANCTRANGEKLTHVNNLRVRALGFEGHFRDCGLFGQQACGHLFADTDNQTLQGQIFNKDGSTEMTLNFGANFRAQDRLVAFERFPGIWPWSLKTDKSGSVSCTSGTGINIRVQILFTLNLNGNDLLC